MSNSVGLSRYTEIHRICKSQKCEEVVETGYWIDEDILTIPVCHLVIIRQTVPEVVYE